MPFSLLCRMIYNYCRSLAPSRSQSQGNLTIPSSPGSITRMRCFTATHNQYSNGHLLPLYANVCAVEIEELRFEPRSPSNLSKTFINLTFQAALVILQTMSSSPSEASQDQQTHVFRAAIVIAFAASLSGSFLSHSKPRLAAILGKTAYLSFAMGFFAMSRVFLSGSWFMWAIGWLAGGFTMLAFLISCLI